MRENFHASSLKIADRMRAYREAIQALISDKLSLHDKIQLVEQLKLPTRLVMLTDQTVMEVQQFCNEDYTAPEDTDYMSRGYLVLNVFEQALKIQDFFEGWDILLILAYLQVMGSEGDTISENAGIESFTLAHEALEHLIFLHREIQNEFDFIHRYIDFSDAYANTRRTASEELEELESSYREFLCSTMMHLKARADSAVVEKELLSGLKALYRSMSPLDDDGFDNMYDYLGFIFYHGTEHMLYGVTHELLEDYIQKKFLALSLQERLCLLCDEEIERVAKDNSNRMSEMRGIESLEQLLIDSYAYDNCLLELKDKFISSLPQYDPYASKDSQDPIPLN